MNPYIPATNIEELEDIATAEEAFLYLTIKSFPSGCTLGSRQLAMKAKLSKGSFGRCKQALLDKDRIYISETKSVLGGQLQILKIKASQPGALKKLKSPTVGHLEELSAPKREVEEKNDLQPFNTVTRSKIGILSKVKRPTVGQKKREKIHIDKPTGNKITTPEGFINAFDRELFKKGDLC